MTEYENTIHTYTIVSKDRDTYYLRKDLTKGVYRLCMDVFMKKSLQKCDIQN